MGQDTQRVPFRDRSWLGYKTRSSKCCFRSCHPQKLIVDVPKNFHALLAACDLHALNDVRLLFKIALRLIGSLV